MFSAEEAEHILMEVDSHSFFPGGIRKELNEDQDTNKIIKDLNIFQGINTFCDIFLFIKSYDIEITWHGKRNTKTLGYAFLTNYICYSDNMVKVNYHRE